MSSSPHNSIIYENVGLESLLVSQLRSLKTTIVKHFKMHGSNFINSKILK